ncbi:hypothetical protein GQ457_14G024180 [Hibiscus cannabinus]
MPKPGLEAVNVFPPSLPKELYCTFSFSFLVLKLMMRPCCLSQFWEGRIGVLDGKKRKKNEKLHNDKHFGGGGGEKGTVKKLGMCEEDEETTFNRKLAKDLIDKWSRPIFNKSTRFEDRRNVDDDRVPTREETPANRASSMRWADATPMDFVVRPWSKIDPDEIRARAKQVVQDQRRLKMNKKLQQLKAPKKKQLQVTKLNAEGLFHCGGIDSETFTAGLIIPIVNACKSYLVKREGSEFDGKKRKKKEKRQNDKHFGGGGGDKGTVKKLGMCEEDEETTFNRKLAKDLIDKWSRPMLMMIGPEATPMDFVVRPRSKIDPDEIRARAKQVVQDQRRLKMNKKLQQLKAPKKKQLQATKLNADVQSTYPNHKASVSLIENVSGMC